MPQFRSGKKHLWRGDTLVLSDGRQFTVAERTSFASTEEVEEFLANSREVFFKEYPAFFCCFGGSPVPRRGLVRRTS